MILKVADIYINGNKAGSYGQYNVETDAEFEENVKMSEAYLVREAYKRFKTVSSRIVVKEQAI